VGPWEGWLGPETATVEVISVTLMAVYRPSAGPESSR